MTTTPADAAREIRPRTEHALSALVTIPGVRRASDLDPGRTPVRVPVEAIVNAPATTLLDAGAEKQVPPVVTAGDDVLPVRAEIAELLPMRGLRRGTVATVQGSATLAWLLLVDAVRAGSWAAIVGVPEASILAGLSLGVPGERLLLIPDPGPQLATVLSALLDAVDLLVLDPADIRPALARSVTSRARQRRRVVLPTGPWPGADLDVNATDITWSGIGHHTGRVTTQSLDVRVTGRGVAARATSSRIRLDWTTTRAATCTAATLPSITIDREVDRHIDGNSSDVGATGSGTDMARRIVATA